MSARWKKIATNLCEEKRNAILEEVFALEKNVHVMGSYPLLKMLDQVAMDSSLILQTKADCFGQVIRAVLHVLPESRAVYQTISSPLSCNIDCYLYDELVFRVFLVEVFATHCSPIMLLDKHVVFYANKGLNSKSTLFHKNHPQIALPLSTLNNSGTLERKEARLSFLALAFNAKELPCINLDGFILQRNDYEKQSQKFTQQFLQGKIVVEKVITLQLQACRGNTSLSCDIGSFIFTETAQAKLEEIYATTPYSTKVPLVSTNDIDANPHLTPYYCLRVAEKRPSFRHFDSFQDFLNQIN